MWFFLARLFESDPEWHEFDINPLILYEDGCVAGRTDICRMEERDTPPATGALPDPGIFYPGSVAFIGASTDPQKIGALSCSGT